VRGGGHLIVAFKSGFANEYSTVRWTKAPGPLREAAGFYYQEFSSLKEPLSLRGDPYKAGDQNRVSVWAEFLIPESAAPLAFYDHPFFGKYPALTRNKFGAGTLTYEGTYLTDDLQRKVILEVLAGAGLTGPDQSLPENVVVKHGTSAGGKPVHYYLNYSARPQTFSYSYASGTDLLGGRPVAPKASVTLGAWDVAIVEEN
jgi:beta-galactosidase